MLINFENIKTVMKGRKHRPIKDSLNKKQRRIIRVVFIKA